MRKVEWDGKPINSIADLAKYDDKTLNEIIHDLHAATTFATTAKKFKKMAKHRHSKTPP